MTIIGGEMQRIYSVIEEKFTGEASTVALAFHALAHSIEDRDTMGFFRSRLIELANKSEEELA